MIMTCTAKCAHFKRFSHIFILENVMYAAFLSFSFFYRVRDVSVLKAVSY